MLRTVEIRYVHWLLLQNKSLFKARVLGLQSKGHGTCPKWLFSNFLTVSSSLRAGVAMPSRHAFTLLHNTNLRASGQQCRQTQSLFN